VVWDRDVEHRARIDFAPSPGPHWRSQALSAIQLSPGSLPTVILAVIALGAAAVIFSIVK
jgi:hypothetical protein